MTLPLNTPRRLDTCTFCNRPADTTVGSDTAYICEECVDLAKQLFIEHREKKREAEAAKQGDSE